jgi:hypothetical protein
MLVDELLVLGLFLLEAAIEPLGEFEFGIREPDFLPILLSHFQLVRKRIPITPLA